MRLKQNLDSDELFSRLDGDFWYDLTLGGYIKPEDYLAVQDDIKRVKDAISVIVEFQNALESYCEEDYNDEDDE